VNSHPPSLEFVKLFAKQVYDGMVTPKILEQFTTLVKKSIAGLIIGNGNSFYLTQKLILIIVIIIYLWVAFVNSEVVHILYGFAEITPSILQINNMYLLSM
jgi:hypothetical protein